MRWNKSIHGVSFGSKSHFVGNCNNRVIFISHVASHVFFWPWSIEYSKPIRLQWKRRETLTGGFTQAYSLAWIPVSWSQQPCAQLSWSPPEWRTPGQNGWQTNLKTDKHLHDDSCSKLRKTLDVEKLMLNRKPASVHTFLRSAPLKPSDSFTMASKSENTKSLMNEGTHTPCLDLSEL